MKTSTETIADICTQFNEVPAPEANAVFTYATPTRTPALSTGNEWARMSSIGKPLVVTAVNKYLQVSGLPKLESTFTPSLQSMMVWGNVFEEWLIYWGCGSKLWKLLSTQSELELGIMKGHTDAIVQLPNGETVLLEVKTLSPNYTRVFTKEPNDDRGYVTQLSLYSKLTQLPAYWLILDKSNFRLSFIELDKTHHNTTGRIERAINVVDYVQDVTTIEELSKLPCPPPKPEVYRHNTTGAFLVPDSMKYSKLVDVYYETSVELNGYNKPTEYVLGFNEPETVAEKLRLLFS